MTTEKPWQITPLALRHCRSLAECHIACWREAYRGIVPDHHLAAFDVDRRAAQWERSCRTDPGTTLALTGDTVIGFASAGPARDDAAAAPRELHAMYVRAPWYGTGVAHDLMRAVLPSATVVTSLWVFQENPRAQSFYRKYGFELDGARRPERFANAVEVRMIRPATSGPATSGR